jgi:hypothetical protein
MPHIDQKGKKSWAAFLSKTSCLIVMAFVLAQVPLGQILRLSVLIRFGKLRGDRFKHFFHGIDFYLPEREIEMQKAKAHVLFFPDVYIWNSLKKVCDV